MSVTIRMETEQKKHLLWMMQTCWEEAEKIFPTIGADWDSQGDLSLEDFRLCNLGTANDRTVFFIFSQECLIDPILHSWKSCRCWIYNRNEQIWTPRSQLFTDSLPIVKAPGM